MGWSDHGPASHFSLFCLPSSDAPHGNRRWSPPPKTHRCSLCLTLLGHALAVAWRSQRLTMRDGAFGGLPVKKRAMHKRPRSGGLDRSPSYFAPRPHINPHPHTRTASNQSTPTSVRVDKVEPRPNTDVSAQRTAHLAGNGFGFGVLRKERGGRGGVRRARRRWCVCVLA